MSDENAARVNGTFIKASFKHAYEICKLLRGKKLDKAVDFLKKVEKKQVAVPMTRYKREVPHKPGIGPGKYPVKASKSIRELLESAVKNAESQGMKKEKLVIKTLEATRAVSARRAARYRRGKLTNIKVVVKEE